MADRSLFGAGAQLTAREKTVAKRQAVEKRIARRFLSDAIKLGYVVEVNDDENGYGDDVYKGNQVSKALAAMFSTDGDLIRLYLTADGTKSIGWVQFVYGNDGWDVIADYSDNAVVNSIMAMGTEALIDSLQ